MTDSATSTAPLVKEISLNAPVERVWKALTDNAQMKEWYFDIADFKPEVGFEFSFTGQGSDCEDFVHECRITKVEPLKLLQHTWTYKDHSGESVLTWELMAEGDKTHIKLTHEGLHTFAAHGKDFGRDSFNAGWEEIVKTNLKKYVEQ